MRVLPRAHHSAMSTSQASLPIAEFVTQLSAKQPTPGGGAAAAVGGAIGAAAAQMAAAYTQRKKDIESGAATSAQELIAKLDTSALLASADADAAAYADLQRSWKDAEMTAEEKAKIEATALAVPVGLIEGGAMHGNLAIFLDFVIHRHEAFSCNLHAFLDHSQACHFLSLSFPFVGAGSATLMCSPSRAFCRRAIPISPRMPRLAFISSLELRARRTRPSWSTRRQPKRRNACGAC